MHALSNYARSKNTRSSTIVDRRLKAALIIRTKLHTQQPCKKGRKEERRRERQKDRKETGGKRKQHCVTEKKSRSSKKRKEEESGERDGQRERDGETGNIKQATA